MEREGGRERERERRVRTWQRGKEGLDGLEYFIRTTISGKGEREGKGGFLKINEAGVDFKIRRMSNPKSHLPYSTCALALPKYRKGSNFTNVRW